MVDPAFASSSPHWACLISTGRIPAANYEVAPQVEFPMQPPPMYSQEQSPTPSQTEARQSPSTQRQSNPTRALVQPSSVQMSPYAPVFYPMSSFAQQPDSPTPAPASADAAGDGGETYYASPQTPEAPPAPFNYNINGRQPTPLPTFFYGADSEPNINSFGLGMSPGRRRNKPANDVDASAPSRPFATLGQNTAHERPDESRSSPWQDLHRTSSSPNWVPYAYATVPDTPPPASTPTDYSDSVLESFPSFEEFARQIDGLAMPRDEYLATLRNLLIRANDMLLPLLGGPFSQMTPTQMASYTTAILDTQPLHPSLFLSPNLPRPWMGQSNWELPPCHPHSLTPQDLARINARSELVDVATQTEFRCFCMMGGYGGPPALMPPTGVPPRFDVPPPRFDVPPPRFDVPPPPLPGVCAPQSSHSIEQPAPPSPQQLTAATAGDTSIARRWDSPSPVPLHTLGGTLRVPESSNSANVQRYGYRMNHNAPMPCRFGPIGSGRPSQRNNNPQTPPPPPPKPPLLPLPVPAQQQISQQLQPYVANRFDCLFSQPAEPPPVSQLAQVELDDNEELRISLLTLDISNDYDISRSRTSSPYEFTSPIIGLPISRSSSVNSEHHGDSSDNEGGDTSYTTVQAMDSTADMSSDLFMDATTGTHHSSDPSMLDGLHAVAGRATHEMCPGPVIAVVIPTKGSPRGQVNASAESRRSANESPNTGSHRSSDRVSPNVGGNMTPNLICKMSPDINGGIARANGSPKISTSPVCKVSPEMGYGHNSSDSSNMMAGISRIMGATQVSNKSIDMSAHVNSNLSSMVMAETANRSVNMCPTVSSVNAPNIFSNQVCNKLTDIATNVSSDANQSVNMGPHVSSSIDANMSQTWIGNRVDANVNHREHNENIINPVCSSPIVHPVSPNISPNRIFNNTPNGTASVENCPIENSSVNIGSKTNHLINRICHRQPDVIMSVCLGETPSAHIGPNVSSVIPNMSQSRTCNRMNVNDSPVANINVNVSHSEHMLSADVNSNRMNVNVSHSEYMMSPDLNSINPMCSIPNENLINENIPPNPICNMMPDIAANDNSNPNQNDNMGPNINSNTNMSSNWNCSRATAIVSPNPSNIINMAPNVNTMNPINTNLPSSWIQGNRIPDMAANGSLINNGNLASMAGNHMPNIMPEENHMLQNINPHMNNNMGMNMGRPMISEMDANRSLHHMIVNVMPNMGGSVALSNGNAISNMMPDMNVPNMNMRGHAVPNFMSEMTAGLSSHMQPNVMPPNMMPMPNMMPNMSNMPNMMPPNMVANMLPHMMPPPHMMPDMRNNSLQNMGPNIMMPMPLPMNGNAGPNAPHIMPNINPHLMHHLMNQIPNMGGMFPANINGDFRGNAALPMAPNANGMNMNLNMNPEISSNNENIVHQPSFISMRPNHPE